MSQIVSRLRDYVVSKDISIRQFELSIGVSSGAISRAFKNDTDIQSKWISKIIHEYPDINIEWLITGKGDMIKPEKDVHLSNPHDVHLLSEKQFNSTTKKVYTEEGKVTGKVRGKVEPNINSNPQHSTLPLVREPQEAYTKVISKPVLVTVDNSGAENIIFVPVKAAAGYLVGLHDPEYIESLPAFGVPTLQNGVFRAFEVQGYSMLAEEGRGLYPSDIVIAQYVESPLEVIDWRVYVVISRDEGIIVKRCLNRIRENNKLICNSDNKNGEYPPIILESEQILETWEFKAVISRQIPRPGDLFSRLNNLEARMALLEQQKLNPS
ncbi:hypothetical protein [Roseivirga sp. UBA1976]|uniref:S24 family peptidase n=1 Tax=Roseivirga sp. UBA1976 TaxID=1947386 RepID=UPI00257E46AD|nr:hypothetical protein [Roseivirga sp. UBA1976]|tara:strand:+ start:15022 stop:15993 length:972 start_codon:yes stop_codon:yes gene_type:complete